MPGSPPPATDTIARLMLVALSLIWGSTWPAMKIALDEIPPFSMRLATTVLAASAMFVIAFAQGRPLAVKRPTDRLHLVVSGFLNVGCFTLLTAFAQLATSTSRVAVLTYTMPIWATLLAYPILGERLDAVRGISLMLGTLGLAVLIYPLIGSSDLIGVLLAVITGVAWASGTVYLKWAQVKVDPVAMVAWQLMVALVLTIAGLLVVEGSPHLWPIHRPALLALIYAAVFGSGLAYPLWFEIVRRLPATTASLGVLGAPVVGFIASIVVLGERPTLADIIGSTLILAAAAFVVLPGAPRGAR